MLLDFLIGKRPLQALQAHALNAQVKQAFLQNPLISERSLYERVKTEREKFPGNEYA
jgi:hypothetical protein